jgi:broad specificity phosphatase PhoE
MQLTLIRHGRPAADLSTRITGRHFAAWLAAYDQAGLDPALPPPAALAPALADCRRLFTSPTRRASESARVLSLATSLTPEILPAAVEAPLPISVPWPFPCRPATLTVVARIFWLLRLAEAPENRAVTHRRVRQLAAQLTASARDAGSIALVGHGYLHLLVRPVLAQAGWRRIHTSPRGYWSYSQFAQ